VLESRQQLFKEGALPRKSVDDAAVAYAQAKALLETANEHLRTLQSVGKQAQVNAANAAVTAAEGQLRSAQAQVSYSEIRALISGVVSDRPVYPGDMAQPGTPLLTIVDIARVVARANVPQVQASQIRVGQPATIRLTEADLTVPGKVTVVSPATDPASTTVQVWVEANNPGERLKPGASVQVSIVTEILKDVVIVPSAAILPGEGGGTAVLVLGADSTVHQKKVEIGVREGDKVQLLSGVSPGDQIVTVGGVGVDDNSKVRVVQPGAKDEDEKPDTGGNDANQKKD
jgi:RND family efflux transporter MFP subunit